MDDSDIVDGRFGGQMKIFHFQKINPVGVSAHEKHCWEQDFQSVSFMKTDEDFKKILGVVSAHRMAFECKDNFYPLKIYDCYAITSSFKTVSENYF